MHCFHIFLEYHVPYLCDEALAFLAGKTNASIALTKYPVSVKYFLTEPKNLYPPPSYNFHSRTCYENQSLHNVSFKFIFKTLKKTEFFLSFLGVILASIDIMIEVNALPEK